MKKNPSQREGETDYGGDGVLRFVCPCCGYVFRYKRGRIKNPSIKEVNAWLTQAQCRSCGVHINAYNREILGAVRDRVLREIDLGTYGKRRTISNTQEKQ